MCLSTLSPKEFTERGNALLAQACPSNDSKAQFHHYMTAAKAQGMSWVEGLE
jgi:hypothetical protein